MNLTHYYTHISRYPKISKEDEVILFARYFDSECLEPEKEKIKAKIISSNLRFAFKEAKKFSKGDHQVFEELILAANDGLIVGFNKFNPESGVRYLTYAGWWVKQRILEEMAHMRVVSLPKSKQQLATKIQRMKERSETDLSQADLEALLPDNNPRDIKDLSDTRYLTFYIEDLEEELFEVDPLAEEVDVNIDNHKVWQAVAALPSPHREVISRLFGMEDGKEVSITTICKALKISKEQVRKIRAEGLAMLQEKLGSGAEFF